MDFKSLMAAQISKSKPPTTITTTTTNTASNGTKSSSSSTTPSVAPSPANNTSKYLRRSEVEAARIAAYNASQAQIEAERESRAAKRRKLEEDDADKNAAREEKKRKLAEESRLRRQAEEVEEARARRKRLGLPEAEVGDGKIDVIEGEENGGEDKEWDDIPDGELRSKLREIGEPAVMWDEDHRARLKRWYKITTLATAATATAVTSSKPKKYPGPVPTTLTRVPEADMLVPNPATTPIPDLKSQSEEYTFLHRQLSSYFTLLLSEWSTSLAARPQEVKSSQSGKQAYTTYLSVLRDLTPLYRKLESQSLPLDLLKPIVEIVHFAQSRRYVDANDGYLRLSIGKAAWPIGVTMVGIHERSAREKLHQDGRDGGERNAHIMSDEVTRKMLQSIKRCLSFAQVRWPPSDLGQLMG